MVLRSRILRIVTFALTTGMVAGLCHPLWAAAASRPNILLIVMDATRADHLSLYGYRRDTSPQIDQVAAEGITYDACIATASWTLPSLASYFTGKPVRDHQVSAQNLTLGSRHTTLAELLRREGYRTAGFSCNAWVGSFSGLDRGFDAFEDVWKGLNSSSADAGAEVTNELVLDWIDYEAGGKPFFVYAHYFEPHFPYRPPVPYDRKFLSPKTLPADVAEVRSWESPRELGYILRAPGYELTTRQLELVQAEYDGEIAYLDSRIGELLDALRDRKLLDQTLVIIAADHGEHLGDHHLLDHKMSLYEPLIRVPLVIRYPGAFPAGRHIQAQVQTTAVLPTILATCGLPALPGAPAPLPVSEPPSAMERTAFSEFAQPDLFVEVIEQKLPGVDHSAFDRSLTSARTSRYQFIWASDGRHELFDLQQDPAETVNLYATQAAVARALLRSVLDFRSKAQ